MAVQELNIHALWVAKQIAKGTPNTAGTKRLVQVGGDINVQREDGSENFSDMSKFGDATDWLNLITGNGAPIAEMTPEELAYLLWIFHGGETVTNGVNNVQTLTMTGTPTGGNCKITDGAGKTTAVLPHNCASAAAQTALEAAFGAGNVTVSGGPWPGAALVVTFVSARGNRPMRTLKIADNALTGGSSPTFTAAQTTPGVKRKHSFVPLPGLGFWSTWHRRVGQSLVTRYGFNDVQMSQLVYEASTGAKAGRITSTLMSLDPGEVKAADPSTALTAKRPFLHTDGVGAFTLQGLVHRGLSQFQVTLNEDLQPVSGDDATVYDLVTGNASAAIQATIYFDADGLARYNEQIYGTASPATGTKPQRTLPSLGAFVHDLKAKDPDDGFENGDRVVFTATGVKWSAPEAPDPNADGGTAEIALQGQLRAPNDGVTPHYTIDVYCDDPAYTT